MHSDDSHPSGSAQIPAASSSTGMEAPDPMIGQQIDRYRVVSKLGEGGMGEVYAAEHMHIQKRVAIKLLRQEVSSNQEAVDRFRQEAQSASSIGHKNIIDIVDFGTLPDGRIFLFMDLLDGEPLNDMIEDGQMDPGRLVNIMIQTGHGLAAAHQKQIVHRDMKPENIFVTTGDVPKLLDFGIAKVSQGEGENHLTRTGTIFGTPFYMAPEQALGQQVDHRVDIYAMGVIMYECFAGSVPFQGESFMGILTQHITSEPEPIEQRAQGAGRFIPPGIAAIVSKAMQKDPNHRHQSMDEMVAELVEVYRNVAGAGMSSYLEAQNIPIAPAHSSTMAAPGLPGVGGQASQSYGSAPGATPVPAMPSGQHIPPSGPQATPQYQTGEASQPNFPAMGAADSLAMPVQKKSKVGLIIAIIATLAVAGGAVAFVMLSGGKKGDETAQNAGENESDAGGESESDAGGTGASGNTPAIDAGTENTEADAATPTATIDAGAVEATPDASTEQKPIKVLIKSRPQGATVFLNGEKWKRKTPTLVEILPGTKIKLQRRRYEDKEEVWGGEGDEVFLSLKKTRTTTTTTTKPPDKPDKPDKPVHPACRKNPRSVECRCKGNADCICRRDPSHHACLE